jgi:MFS family permease
LHTFATIAMLEMWGQRAQPWLQVKPFALGIGGVIGPVLVSTYGYRFAFVIAGVVCGSCIAVYMVVYLLSRTRNVVKWITKQIKLRKPSAHSSESVADATTGVDHDTSSATFANKTIIADKATTVSASSSSHTSVTESDSLLSSHGDGSKDQQEIPNNDDDVAIDMYLARDIVAAECYLSDEIRGITDSGHRLPSVEVPSPAYTNDQEEFVFTSSFNHVNINRTLSFATPSMVSKLEVILEDNNNTTVGVTLVPFKFRVFTGLFALFFSGLFYSFSGWVTSYASITGIATSSADASHLTSVFFFWVTAGSLFSVPCSVIFSTTVLLRYQLTFALMAAVITVLLGVVSYYWLTVSTALFGYGLSCVFPLIICLANDYKFTM